MPPSNGSDGGLGQEALAGGALIIIAGGTVAAATNSDQTGPILAFVGALLVAVIAAITAGRRQRRALDAERARLAQQLGHDRQLSDLAHLRELLDHAAQIYESAYNALLNTAMAVIEEQAPEQLWAKYETAEGARVETVSTWRRLLLRFAPDHPIVVGYGRCVKGFGDGLKALLDGPVRSGGEGPWDLDELDPYLDEVRAGLTIFTGACQDLIGPRTASGEPPPAT